MKKPTSKISYYSTFNWCSKYVSKGVEEHRYEEAVEKGR